MVNLSPYCEYILDILQPYGHITAKSMFGGYGIYKDGTIVAIIADDEVYFKVDQSNQAQYEQLGAMPFTYEAKGKKAQMSYWQMPAEILEDSDQLPIFLEQSYQISLKVKRPKKRSNR